MGKYEILLENDVRFIPIYIIMVEAFMYDIVDFDKEYEDRMIDFFEICLPESGRKLDINGRHACYKDIYGYFKKLWLMIEDDKVIGAVAVKELTETNCELRSLYLLEKYHGQG